jgi:hypothetical protein
MAKKVRALTTTAGDYGLARPGSEFVTSDQTALQLEAKGLVEVLSDEPDEAISVPRKIRGSISITKSNPEGDAPGPAFEETNRHDPTGEARARNRNL